MATMADHPDWPRGTQAVQADRTLAPERLKSWEDELRPGFIEAARTRVRIEHRMLPGPVTHPRV